MRITKRRLRQIIKEEKARLVSEMPVSKSPAYFSRDIGTRRPELQALAEEIDSMFQEWGIVANIQLFDSGYQGISIKFTGYDGSSIKWMIIDQPGKVGLEDQATGYIFFGPSGPIDKSRAWVWEKPDYNSRGYGDVGIQSQRRQQVYDMIIDVIDTKLRGPI